MRLEGRGWIDGWKDIEKGEIERERTFIYIKSDIYINNKNKKKSVVT